MAPAAEEKCSVQTGIIWVIGRGSCTQAGHSNHFLMPGKIEKRKIIPPAKIGQFMEGKIQKYCFPHWYIYEIETGPLSTEI